MSFREKTAWAMCLVLGLIGANYFSRVIAASLDLGHVAPPSGRLIIMFIIVLVIASIIANTLIASLAPKEAGTPADERERAIQNRAGNISGYVLAAGAVTALWQYTFNPDASLMFHTVFAGLILSQLADYVLQIIFYRRGV